MHSFYCTELVLLPAPLAAPHVTAMQLKWSLWEVVHFSLLGGVGGFQLCHSGVLTDGPTFRDQWGQVVTTDPSIINLSMEKTVEHPLSELGRLGESGSWELSFTHVTPGIPI